MTETVNICLINVSKTEENTVMKRKRRIKVLKINTLSLSP